MKLGVNLQGKLNIHETLYGREVDISIVGPKSADLHYMVYQT